MKKESWFKSLFNDGNDINEKSVIGFASFIIMTLFAIEINTSNHQNGVFRI
jgi:hypothetical protein